MSTLNPIVDYNPIALATKSIFSHSKLLTNLSSFFAKLFCKNIPINAQKLLFSFGTVAILYKVISLIYTTHSMWKWVPAHTSNRKQVNEQEMKKKYGDCYAVVTGCTQGIGLSYAIQLARMNFGVVLVARNKQKLQKRIQQIKNIIPNFRYEIVIGDFSKPDDIKKIVNQLISLSKKIDIGIVINNAGLAGQKFKKYIEQDIKLLKDVLYVNFNATYHINAAMIPILRNRKYRSAILNLSSCTGVFVSHGNGTYSSSKMMTDIYSRTMSIQNRDKIDIISVRPFGVRTPMMNMKKGKFMITPQDCVISSFADLGHFDTTWSGFMHKVQAAYFERMTEEKRLEIYDKLFSGFK